MYDIRKAPERRAHPARKGASGALGLATGLHSLCRFWLEQALATSVQRQETREADGWSAQLGRINDIVGWLGWSRANLRRLHF